MWQPRFGRPEPRDEAHHRHKRVRFSRVFRRLAKRYPGIDPDPIVALLVKKAVLVRPARLPERVCADPDDDKFVAAAIGGQAEIVVSGDRHLLDVSGRRGLVVMNPSAFLDHFESHP